MFCVPLELISSLNCTFIDVEDKEFRFCASLGKVSIKKSRLFRGHVLLALNPPLNLFREQIKKKKINLFSLFYINIPLAGGTYPIKKSSFFTPSHSTCMPWRTGARG